MKDLKKTTQIIVLTYLFLGASNLYSSDFIFIAPMSVKPFFLLVLLAAYIFSIYLSKQFKNTLNLVFGVWLFTYAFTNTYFVEFFFDYQTIKVFSDYLEPSFRLISILSLITCCTLIYKRLKETSSLYLIPIIISILIIPAVLLLPYHYSYDLGIILVGLTYFIINSIRGNQENIEQFNQQWIILYGIGIIGLMDLVSLM